MIDVNLKDLSSVGGLFTWRGGINNQQRARLDRFLVNDEWENLFSNVVQTVLPNPLSDHFPIALEGDRGLVRGPSPFRFENMWLKDDGLMLLIRGWWQGLSFRGSNSFILAQNLKALKTKLKVWILKVFGRVDSNKASAQGKILG